jgi:hypothetical protein
MLCRQYLRYRTGVGVLSPPGNKITGLGISKIFFQNPFGVPYCSEAQPNPALAGFLTAFRRQPGNCVFHEYGLWAMKCPNDFNNYHSRNELNTSTIEFN